MRLSYDLLLIIMQMLQKKSYSYVYGVSVNPISIHIDQKFPLIVKKHFIDLPSFELPDGSRPFKHYDYKDALGTRIMGSLSHLKE